MMFAFVILVRQLIIYTSSNGISFVLFCQITPMYRVLRQERFFSIRVLVVADSMLQMVPASVIIVGGKQDNEEPQVQLLN